jgi:hypothetical protein
MKADKRQDWAFVFGIKKRFDYSICSTTTERETKVFWPLTSWFGGRERDKSFFWPLTSWFGGRERQKFFGR